jgi:hypothetical protein
LSIASQNPEAFLASGFALFVQYQEDNRKDHTNREKDESDHQHRQIERLASFILGLAVIEKRFLPLIVGFLFKHVKQTADRISEDIKGSLRSDPANQRYTNKQGAGKKEGIRQDTNDL